MSTEQQVLCPQCDKRGAVRAAGNGKLYCELCYSLTPAYKRGDQKVGRNKPCPCDSGKKFKFCCLRG